MSELCVVRYAEIFLKGQNRHFFEERLQRNLRAALKPLEGAHVQRLHGRMLVDPGPAGSSGDAGQEASLEAGMVLNLETPYYELGFGGLQVEDTLLVTASGYEFLTHRSRDLLTL